jgi:hypothetical protein
VGRAAGCGSDRCDFDTGIDVRRTIADNAADPLRRDRLSRADYDPGSPDWARWLGALVGGVLGGAAGNAAEKAKKKKPGWDLIILLDNGEEIGIQVPMNKKNRGIFTPGDRVRLMSGPNGQTRVNKI